MDRVANLSPSDQQAFFQEVASRRGLTALVIEKDFWVCWTLRRVFEMPSLGEHLIFKGGTSLSKVFGLIERFSEDIDLSIRRDYLGAVADKDPEQDHISNTERSRRVASLRERCRLAVRAEMLPALRTSFTIHLGASVNASAWQLEPDPNEEGTLLFTYPSVQAITAVPAYIRPQVKLEMGLAQIRFQSVVTASVPMLPKRSPKCSETRTLSSLHLRRSGPSGKKPLSFTPNAIGHPISPHRHASPAIIMI